RGEGRGADQQLSAAEPAQRPLDATARAARREAAECEAGHEARPHRARRVDRDAEDPAEDPRPQYLIDERAGARSEEEDGERQHSVDAAIPIVRAAAGVDVELLADAIDLPLQVAVLDLRDRVGAYAFQVHVADRQTAEVGRARHAAAAFGH